MNNIEEQSLDSVISDNLTPVEKFLNIFFSDTSSATSTDIDTIFDEDKISDFLEKLSLDTFSGKISLAAFNKFKKNNNINDDDFFNFLFDYTLQKTKYNNYSRVFDDLANNINRTNMLNRRNNNKVKSSFVDMLKLNKNSKRICNIRYANKYIKSYSFSDIETKANLLIGKYITLYLFNTWKQKGYIKSSVVSDYTNIYNSSNRISSIFNKIYKANIEELNTKIVDNLNENRSLTITCEKNYSFIHVKKLELKESSNFYNYYKDGYISIHESLQNITSNIYYHVTQFMSDKLFIELSLGLTGCVSTNGRYYNSSNFAIQGAMNNYNIQIVLGSHPMNEQSFHNLNNYLSYFHTSLDKDYLESFANGIENSTSRLLEYCDRLGFSNETKTTEEPLYRTLRKVKYYQFNNNIIDIINSILSIPENSFSVSRLDDNDYILGYLYKLKNIIQLSGLGNLSTLKCDVYMPFLYFLFDFNNILYNSNLNPNLRHIFYNICWADPTDETEILKIIKRTSATNKLEGLGGLSSNNCYKIISSIYNIYLSKLDSSLINKEDLKCKYIFYKHYSDFLNSITSSVKTACEENNFPFDYDVSSIEVLSNVISNMSNNRVVNTGTDDNTEEGE